jgi:hypothetical protein
MQQEHITPGSLSWQSPEEVQSILSAATSSTTANNNNANNDDGAALVEAELAPRFDEEELADKVEK